MRTFLYARKSTDEEDRQVLSIEAQLAELREFAKRESLHIVGELVESKTAKVPGRPIFNAMMARIEKGEAQGILAWHPDRLARNSVDGGQIIYFLDTGKLVSLKFPTFWFENTPQDKFMLNIAFGQSKYYVDNLRENVLRGIRQKLRRGEYPSKPPIGYLNEPRLRTIVVDESKAPLVKRMFEAFATGNYSVPGLLDLATSWGLRTRYGNPITRSHLWTLLANPFYIGLMRVKGELYEASHPPLISKALFEKVQSLLSDRSKPRYKPPAPFAFLGLLRCGECGCAVTAERQKGLHYYHCTKKRGPCSQKGFLREEELARQLQEILLKVSLPEPWRSPIFGQLDKWGHEDAKRSQALLQGLNEKLAGLNLKLERLLDAHLDGVLTRDEYMPRKEKLLNEKLQIKESIDRVSAGGNLWLEPTRKFFELAFQAASMARDGKVGDFFKNVGSNLTLAHRRARCRWEKPWSILAVFEPNSGWWAEEDLNL